MIASGSAVQMKGMGLEIDNAAEDAALECRVSFAKNPSTALSQNAEVGAKWKWNRGCRSMRFNGCSENNITHG
jgi:hypothetical protein